MKKRCKFDFLTTGGHTWINKQHLLDYINEQLDAAFKMPFMPRANKLLTKLIKEIEKCEYKK